MRLEGFKCDRCGKVVTDEDFNRLTEEEIGKDSLSDFNLRDVELCDDCYEEFRYTLRNFVAGYLNYFGSGRNEEDDE